MYKAYEFFTSAPRKLWNGLLGREEQVDYSAMFLDSVDILDHKSMIRGMDTEDTQIAMERIRSKEQADPVVQIGKTKHKVSKLRILGMENLTGYIAMNEKFITGPELSNRKVRAISRRVHEIVYSKNPKDIETLLNDHLPTHLDESTKKTKMDVKEKFGDVMKKTLGKLQIELIMIDNPEQVKNILDHILSTMGMEIVW